MTTVTDSFDRQLERAKTFVEEHDHFLVVSHIHPDGDAISSTCAVGYLLHKLGKSFVLANADPVPAKFSFLYESNDIKGTEQLCEQSPFTHVIAVDCADYSRIGNLTELFSADVQILNIDHHPTNDHYGEVQLIKPEAAATAEVLYDWFETFNLQWDQDGAACIYTGILTDTGGFRYANTSPKVMRIASELLTYGVDAHFMAERLLETCSFSHIRLLQRALSTLSFAADRKISWVYVSVVDMQETGASNEDLEGIVNYPRNIEGVEVGLLFREMSEDVVKVSFRSAGDVDVAQVARHFNGGGHVRAAGATVNKPLQQTIAAVIGTLERELT